MSDPMTARLSVSSQTLARDVDDELVLMDLASEYYFSMNRTGRVVWHAIGEGLNGNEAADRLVADFDVPDATARADVARILGELIDAGLVAPATD